MKAGRDFHARAVPPTQADGQFPFAVHAGVVDQRGNLRKLPGAHDQIHVRGPVKNQRLIFLGHAAHHADDLPRPAFFAVLQPPQLAVDFVLGMLADAARVEQHGVGFADVRRQFVALFAERPHDQFAVQHIHLAADGFDIELKIMGGFIGFCHNRLIQSERQGASRRSGF